MDEPVTRPDDDDHDLLTMGEAGARLVSELNAERRALGELEKQLGYVGEDQEIAAEIAKAEARIEALQAAQARLAEPRPDPFEGSVERGTQALEALEEQFFAYIGEDLPHGADQIAAVERQVEKLKAEQEPG